MCLKLLCFLLSNQTIWKIKNGQKIQNKKLTQKINWKYHELTDSANSGIGSGNLYSAALQMKFDEDWRVFCKGRLNATSFEFELQVLIPRSVEEQEEKGEYEGLKKGVVMKIEELFDLDGWRDKVKALLQAISSVFFSFTNFSLSVLRLSSSMANCLGFQGNAQVYVQGDTQPLLPKVKNYVKILLLYNMMINYYF